MIAAGWGVPQVGRVVGHSNTSTTDRYTHLSVEVTKGPLDSLGKMAAKRVKIKSIFFVGKM
jgi:hypothetical protein